MKKPIVLLFVIIFICSCALFSGHKTDAGNDGQPTSGIGKIDSNPGRLVYLGSFILPSGSGESTSSFDWAFKGLGYNPTPTNTIYSESLFVGGHDHHSRIGEISIPSPLGDGFKTADPANLPRALTIQSPQDFADGRINNLGTDGASIPTGDPDATSITKIGGILVHEGKLLISGYKYYEHAEDARLSHGFSPLDLSGTGDFEGWYGLTLSNFSNPEPGQVAGMTAGNLAAIPEDYQASFGGTVLTGLSFVSIVGRSSFGPSLAVFNPNQMSSESFASATILVAYPEGHHSLGAYYPNPVEPNPVCNMASKIAGLVFPNGSDSVYFFGRTGLGAPIYGEGTADPSLHGILIPGYEDDPEPPVYVYDPANDSKGPHAWPYAPCVWEYKADDLLSVKNGIKQPWELAPSAFYALELPYIDDNKNYEIGGAAYDPLTQRIFLFESRAWGSDFSKGMIHVLGWETNP